MGATNVNYVVPWNKGCLCGVMRWREPECLRTPWNKATVLATDDLPLDFRDCFSPLCFWSLLPAAGHSWCSRLPVVSTFVDVAMFSLIPRGGLWERESMVLDLSFQLPSEHTDMALVLLLYLQQVVELPPHLTLSRAGINGPEASYLLISSSVNCTVKCWVGQVHVVAYGTAYLWHFVLL